MMRHSPCILTTKYIYILLHGRYQSILKHHILPRMRLPWQRYIRQLPNLQLIIGFQQLWNNKW